MTKKELKQEFKHSKYCDTHRAITSECECDYSIIMEAIDKAEKLNPLYQEIFAEGQHRGERLEREKNKPFYKSHRKEKMMSEAS